MQDSPQQRVVDLKRQCRQIHEGGRLMRIALDTART